MTSPLLTLQLPVRGRALALATTSAPEVIRDFCAQVFQEYLRRERQATDEAEAAVYRAELTRLRRVFSLVDAEAWPTREGEDG